MNGRYAVLASRNRQDVADLERVVERAERSMRARRQQPAEHDLLLDAVALNLHDVYSGLERIFIHIASGVDQSVPSGSDWHRELLKQMAIEIPGVRPPVITTEIARNVDELLRFRHVVLHVYTFDLEPERIESLVSRLRPTFHQVSAALLVFATYLEDLARDG